MVDDGSSSAPRSTSSATVRIVCGVVDGRTQAEGVAVDAGQQDYGDAGR